MAYPYICTSCMASDCANCEHHKDMPPPDSGLIGGGVCICQHKKEFSQFEKEIAKRQLGLIGEDE